MNEIILDVCRGNKVHPKEFFGPGQGRDQRLSRVRRIAIHRLRQYGLSITVIARIMQRNRTTIEYWLYPQQRKRRREYSKRYHAARAASV